jgi:quercetin 2,3-dioxygenase
MLAQMIRVSGAPSHSSRRLTPRGATVQAGETIVHDLREGGGAYLVSTTGHVDLHGLYLAPRDGAVISGESQLAITAIDASRGEK